MRIALATCETLPELFTDDQMLAEALRTRGAEAFPLIWSSEEARTLAPDLCVLRNTWDYYLRPAEFLHWAESMAERATLLNPFPLVRWNHHKGYLNIALLAGAAAWSEIVVKPAISAGAHRTARYGAEDPAAQNHLQELTQDCDALVQPYLPSVESYGERSFLFIDGTFSHAVRRTQALSEGVGLWQTMERVQPTEAELTLAHNVVAALPTPTLYARVDLAPGDDGRQLLMEVEVIEPRLFLQECPEAIEKLADAILQRAGTERITAS